MFVIARHSKIKSTGELRAALKHNTREQHTPNANPELTHLNGGDGLSVNASMARYRQELGEHKARKNAVHAVEYLFSASPEFFVNKSRDEILEYFRECTNYVRDKFGTKNVVSVRQHFDETSPHVHVIVIPMHQGKLNAKHYIGGSRAVARQFQEDIGKIGEKYGLKRGNQGSTAKHTTIKEFYAVANLEQRDLVKFAMKGKQHEKAQQINASALKVAAIARKEANKKVSAAKVAEQQAKNELKALKAKHSKALTDHSKALKDIKTSNDKTIKALKNDVIKLTKQLANTTKALKSEKDKRKNAESTADARFKEKNAAYLENIEKDRAANIKNKKINEETAIKLNKKEALLEVDKSRLKEATKNAVDTMNASEIRFSEAVADAVKFDISSSTFTLPKAISADLVLKQNIMEDIDYYVKAAAERAAAKARTEAPQATTDPDPLHTYTPTPEKAAERKTKRHSPF